MRDYRSGFISASEAAARIGVHKSTVFRHAPPDFDWSAARVRLLDRRYARLGKRVIIKTLIDPFTDADIPF